MGDRFSPQREGFAPLLRDSPHETIATMPDTVVGRDRELEAAAELLSRLDGGAAALVFEGEPGIGKTTVWTEAVERAPDRCPVLAARPTKAESPLAFAGLSDLLQPVVDQVLVDLPAPQ